MLGFFIILAETFDIMETTPLFTIKKNKTDFPKKKITSSEDAWNFIAQFYGEEIEVYESFYALYLDMNNTTIGYSKISQGGVSMTVVDTKLIAKGALDSLASNVILTHNHPSGSLRASINDINMTEKIKKTLELIDCKVLDHIIITAEGYHSMADNGGI